MVRRRDRLFTLELGIISGPMPEKFLKKNPVLSRTIQIRGAQSFEILHCTSSAPSVAKRSTCTSSRSEAKGRWTRGRGDTSCPSRRTPRFRRRAPAGDVTRTPVSSVGLKPGDGFGHWFDFGDDWWHQINVVATDDYVPLGFFRESPSAWVRSRLSTSAGMRRNEPPSRIQYGGFYANFGDTAITRNGSQLYAMACKRPRHVLNCP